VKLNYKMFTGIIQDQGKVSDRIIKGDSIKFTAIPLSKKFLKDIKTGDSISINGACMTVERIIKIKNIFEFTTIKESLSKTNLGLLKKGSIVNLEKAMTLRSKLDGHIVQGHIDTTGVIKKVNTLKGSWEYFIEFNSKYRDNIIYTGSIAINGVSLTIAEIVSETKMNVLVKVAIIPHTYKYTNFNLLSEKDTVNIEFDMMGKYVKRISETQDQRAAGRREMPESRNAKL